MNLRIETVYEDIDQEWLDWYLKRLANEEVLPGSMGIVKALRQFDIAKFSSKDPESPCVATTTYEVIR